MTKLETQIELNQKIVTKLKTQIVTKLKTEIATILENSNCDSNKSYSSDRSSYNDIFLVKTP